MKKYSLLMLVAMVATMSVCLTSCSKDDDQNGKMEFIGSWDGIYDFSFDKNGTVTVERGNEVCSGKWKIESSFPYEDDEYIYGYFLKGSDFSKTNTGGDVTHFNGSWFIGIRNVNEIRIIIRTGTSDDPVWYGQEHSRK